MLHAQLDIECPYLTMMKGSAYIESARKEDYIIWMKRLEERKADRDEKKMENEPDKKEMKETPIDQST